MGGHAGPPLYGPHSDATELKSVGGAGAAN